MCSGTDQVVGPWFCRWCGEMYNRRTIPRKGNPKSLSAAKQQRRTHSDLEGLGTQGFRLGSQKGPDRVAGACDRAAGSGVGLVLRCHPELRIA